MTNDKKRPETDEVKDEQLEDVAGGVFLSSSQSGGVLSAFPDVCKTPAPPSPVPVPYPNIGQADDAGTKVEADGKAVDAKGDSTVG